MAKSLTDTYDSSRVVLPPTENGIARGLSRAAYIDDDFLKMEYERVFARNWTFAGFAHEISNPGDAMPVQVAGQPLLLVRNIANEIGAFHNVCRHRGHAVITALCRGLKSLVCPYHAWTYDLDGNLKRTPHFGGYAKHSVDGFSLESHGLKSVRSAVWHDWIFVDLAGEAPALDKYLTPITSRVEDLDFGNLKPLAKLDLGVVQANWKFLIENFVEPYHVPVVHRQSAAGQPLAEHYMIVDDHCIGCGIDVAEPCEDGSRDVLDMSTRYFVLFPNFVFGWYLPNQLGVHLNVPLAPDRTQQWRVIYHIGEQTPDAEYVKRLTELWQRVHREDHEIVESLQRARASSVLEDGGLLSPHWETSVRQFHKLVINALA